MKLSEIKIGDRVGFRYWKDSEEPIKEGTVVAIKPADVVDPPAGHPDHNPASVKIKLDDMTIFLPNDANPIVTNGGYFLTSGIDDLILLPQPAPQTSLVSNYPPKEGSR